MAILAMTRHVSDPDEAGQAASATFGNSGTSPLFPQLLRLRGLGKGLAYWGLNRLGWTPRLSNVQFCIITFRRFIAAVLENGKKRSTDNETTEHCYDNHGIE
jgi:hypothetical protein